MPEKSDDLMEKLVALCKRRGFIFQSSEIYGGINGFWDYGPLGVELKRNIKQIWWDDVVRKRDDMVGLDCSIIMNPKVWEASGHTTGFSDPMVDCRACKARYRADKLYWWVLQDRVGREGKLLAKGAFEADDLEQVAEFLPPELKRWARAENFAPLKKTAQVLLLSDMLPARTARIDVAGEGNQTFCVIAGPGGTEAPHSHPIPCPSCKNPDSLSEPRQFNLMFKTFVGAMEDSSAVAYLRPETAQGIFANYKNVLDTTRLKLPFGIAQIGKAFRNEINPRNYTFRSREFEQMEIEFFCHKDEADKWYAYWRQARFDWYVNLGLRSDRLRLRDHEPDELAHYARACADIEYAFPFGVSELEGVANRTDFDLTQHQNASGRDMTYFDDETKERFIPYVIEPSGGVDRATLAFLCEAYCEDTAPDEHGKPQTRTVMKLHPKLAPIKVAVFPLVKKEGMPEIARGIYEDCKAAALASFYDEKGAVGRRYRRQDEAGTPFCVTVDGQTLQDQTVTIRERDSLKQVRIAADGVVQYVQEHLA
ncbi:MAG TPA: glycine--tRNA ligase [Phycisphaerae bacterium]|nr:glycine--tRNA ligase [Phycisphaerae bacterium]